MKNNVLSILIGSFTLLSCDETVKKTEFDSLNSQLLECKMVVEELRNTPAIRLMKAQEFIQNRNYNQAKAELNLLIERFKESDEAISAKTLLREIEEQQKIADQLEEQKIKLGYKILKETNTVNVKPVTLRFSNITTSNKWNFENDENGYYHYLTAEKDRTFIQTKVSITSEVKKTKIPLLAVYELVNGNLNLLGVMKRQFVNDPNNNYTNVDFKYVNTITLTHALEISKSKINHHPIFIVVRNNNCSLYEKGFYLDSDIKRDYFKDNNQCDIKTSLTINDFDTDYVLIKILNKNKL